MIEENERIGFELGMGWLPDYPDFRDFDYDQDEVARRPSELGQKLSVKQMLSELGVAEATGVTVPTSISLIRYCSPIENQGALGSCTANAGVGLLEYYERRAYGRHIDGSRLFLYKATRNLLRWTGDRGAFLRTTMAAMVLFGVPPEEYWRYIIANFDDEPSAFCYSFAQNYQAMQYFRLDPPSTTKDVLLQRIKAYLTAGLPSMFGFTVFNSIDQARGDGEIPFPCSRERILGGHAVVAVGFDDDKIITNANCREKTKGALLIRNSWGTTWGNNGYGWLPYDYVGKGLATDWWTLLRNEWVDTGNFGPELA